MATLVVIVISRSPLSYGLSSTLNAFNTEYMAGRQSGRHGYLWAWQASMPGAVAYSNCQCRRRLHCLRMQVIDIFYDPRAVNSRAVLIVKRCLISLIIGSTFRL